MKKLAAVLAPSLVVFAFALRAGAPPAAPLAAEPAGRLQRVAAGAALFASNCAVCHGSGVEWTQPGCKPASLAGATQRYSKEQVLNLLDHGVMQMPSFATLTEGDRDLLWEYLSTLPPEPDAAPTPGQHCPRVKAAMAGEPMIGGCAMGCGGRGGGCGAGAACGAGQQARQGRRWSFGR